jgi:hypothetical protein
MVWAPKNKRPEKLKDNIKEMEVSFVQTSFNFMPLEIFLTGRMIAALYFLMLH